jgi:glyoxylase-like metal-dependent hydrolase (beta-lactamase superfamily II)
MFKELDVIPHVNQRGESCQLRVPVSTYLIEHPQGKVVVDSGWHEDMRTNPQEHLGVFDGFVEGVLPEGGSIKEQLAARGFTPSDIAVVVVTHLDLDHISGLRMLKGAGKFMVSEVEWASHARNKEAWYDGLPLEPFAWDAIPHGPYQLGKDLFGDGLVYLVFTPGHTAGHLSVLARVERGWLLLASDVGAAEKSWKEWILPGKRHDEDQAAQSLLWVKQFSERADCVAAIANHDPTVSPATY